MQIDDLSSKLAKTPGITRRNAQKILFHFIRNKEKITEFTKIFQTLYDEVSVCESCGNIAFDRLCSICQNEKRDSTTVCIVEDFEDITNLEKGHWYNGIYHVLGGLLSAQRGMMPDSLNIKTLLEKLHGGKVNEVIFASTSSFEWQATMHFLNMEIQKVENFHNIKITEFAHGMPVGGSFEFMDEGTLQVAFVHRKSVLQG